MGKLNRRRRLAALERLYSELPEAGPTLESREREAVAGDSWVAVLAAKRDRMVSDFMGADAGHFAVPFAARSNYQIRDVVRELDAGIRHYERYKYGRVVETDPSSWIELCERVVRQVLEGLGGESIGDLWVDTRGDGPAPPGAGLLDWDRRH
jgi:hypothetical protein